MSKVKEMLVQQMERLAEVAEDNRLDPGLDPDVQEKLTSAMISLSKEIRAWEQAQNAPTPFALSPIPR